MRYTHGELSPLVFAGPIKVKIAILSIDKSQHARQKNK
jgi:hypothetical protein